MDKEQYVEVQFENGVRDFPRGAQLGPENGFSNYLCDVCGCVLELSDQPRFMPDGSLSCPECYNITFVKK